MSPKYGTLTTPGIHTGEQMFLSADGQNTFIGLWEFGRPVEDERHKLAGVPRFEVGTTPMMVKDSTRANGLLTLRPRDCFEAFQYGRGVTIELYRAAHTLGGKGYGHAARADAMTADVNDALAGLAPHVARLVEILADCDKAEAQAMTTFPESGENDLQVAMNDAAIVARLGDLTPQDRSVMQAGELPPRFRDARAVQALFRVPAAAHGIDADSMAAIGNAYARMMAPHTVQAVDMLRGMVEAARAVCAPLAVTCARLAARPVDQAFAVLPSGAWLAQRSGFTRDQLRVIDEGKTAGPALTGTPKPRMAPQRVV